MEIKELVNKNDYINVLKDIVRPAIGFFDEKESCVSLPGYYATSYDDSVLQLESFSRLLWGLLHLDNTFMDENAIIRMICNGVNPESRCYWGKIENYSQKIVETFPVLFYLINKESAFDKLTGNEKNNIEKWFGQINSVKVSENNWEFFVILANIALKELGLQYSEKSIEQSWNKIEKMYLGNGWYADGNTNQRDYYISFAMHFYSLIYYKFTNNKDRKEKIKERALLFSKKFISWFDENGSAIPFGRSLTYKFAQVAFWSALVYSEIDRNNNAFYKGIINRNIRWWLSKDIFSQEGLLTIGYAYENQTFSEYYNGTGSSYWCLKSFLFLMLPENNDFFYIKETELPVLSNVYDIPEAKMIICRYEGVPYAFVNGQRSVNCFGHTECKYEKFVYSTLFGFCISKSYLSLELLSADSNLAISFNNKDFSARHACQKYINQEDEQISIWTPQEGVMIKSVIIPSAPRHVRVHLIKTDKRILLVDHGFAAKKEDAVKECKEGVARVKNNIQISSVESIIGNGEPIIVESVPNTNAIYNRVLIPAIKWELNPGNYVLCDEVVGCSNYASAGTGFSGRIRLSNKTIRVGEHEVPLDDCNEEPYKITGCLKKIKKAIKRIKRTV